MGCGCLMNCFYFPDGGTEAGLLLFWLSELHGRGSAGTWDSSCRAVPHQVALMFAPAGYSSLHRHSLQSQSQAVGQQSPLPVPQLVETLGRMQWRPCLWVLTGFLCSHLCLGVIPPEKASVLLQPIMYSLHHRPRVQCLPKKSLPRLFQAPPAPQDVAATTKCPESLSLSPLGARLSLPCSAVPTKGSFHGWRSHLEPSMTQST